MPPRHCAKTKPIGLGKTFPTWHAFVAEVKVERSNAVLKRCGICWGYMEGWVFFSKEFLVWNDVNVIGKIIFVCGCGLLGLQKGGDQGTRASLAAPFAQWNLRGFPIIDPLPCFFPCGEWADTLRGVIQLPANERPWPSGNSNFSPKWDPNPSIFIPPKNWSPFLGLKQKTPTAFCGTIWGVPVDGRNPKQPPGMVQKPCK